MRIACCEATRRFIKTLIAASALAGWGLCPCHAKGGADSDGDGLPDSWELSYFADLATADGAGDPDGDLIPNWQEHQLGNNPTAAESLGGALLHELWAGLPRPQGGPRADVESVRRSREVLQPPTLRGLVYTSAGPTAYGDDYGNRLRGYITAPASGDYLFWIAGDDGVQMWLSGSEDKFGRELLIAPHLLSGPGQWDIDVSQRSRPVALEAGKRYYIEVWHQETSGMDHVSVAWQPPGGERGLIPGAHLSTYAGQANDLDDDDLPDDWELANGLDPADNGAANPANGAYADPDGDGLPNIEELEHGTRADLADSDGDGVSDFDEVKLLQTQALVGDVAPFQHAVGIQGSAFTASGGAWGVDGQAAYTQKSRGWVEYTAAVPSGGVYLLDLALRARAGGALGDECEAIFWVDGQRLGRARTLIPPGATGRMKVLTPWLPAGAHKVRVFIDNTLTFRQVEVRSLNLLSAQGSDLDLDGTPDWVEARIALGNGIDSPVTSSKVSPVCLEGRARYLDLAGATRLDPATMLPLGPVPLHAAPGDRWFADVPLDPKAPTIVAMGFENGAASASRPVTWEATNLLEETHLTVRAGDSLRLTAHNGGPGEVWLTVGGQTHYFNSGEPMVYQFAAPGTSVLDVVHYGVHGVPNPVPQLTLPEVTVRQVTVEVVGAPVVESPITVTGHLREWDVKLPKGTVLELDPRAGLRASIDLGGGSWRHEIQNDETEDRVALVRLGAGGPVLVGVPVRSLKVKEGSDTGATFVRDFGDGSFQVDMLSVASSRYADALITYDIFESGVSFLDGSIHKAITGADYDEFGVYTLQFLKVGTAGSNCHRTSIWQNWRRIAYLY